MTDESSGSVRRVGRKDRKRQITSSVPLFPEEGDGQATDGKSVPVVAPDIDSLEKDIQPTEGDLFPVTLAEIAILRQVPPSQRRGVGGCIPNLLTLLFVTATAAALVLFVVIARNPYSPLNPFPPFTPLPIIVTATFLPPTPTSELLPGPTETFTPLPPESFAPIGLQFVLEGGVPAFTANTNGQGCNWLSIAGSVIDSSGTGMSGYRVRIVGTERDETVFSGTAPSYGNGGFELVLGNIPAEQNYVVQLQTPRGEAVSPEYAVVTQADCAANVMILRFVQVGTVSP
jgi:hypothetical protein